MLQVRVTEQGTVRPSPQGQGAGAILMYHRIASQDPDTYGLCVRPDDFRAQLQHLDRAGYQVVPLQDLVRTVDDDGHRGRCVALTFDDGYSDALLNASEILSEFSFPATFFIVGSALAPGYEFWWDTLERVFLRGCPVPTAIKISWPGGRLELPTSTDTERRMCHDRLVEVCYVLPRRARDEAIQAILDWSGAHRSPEGEPRPLTREQVISLARRPGVAIGAHTESHLWLSSQAHDVRRQEIMTGKRRLEDLLAGPIDSFSYPYGSHDPVTVDMVRQAGFAQAVTTEERKVMPGEDPFLLPRCNVGVWEREAFADRLARVFEEPASAPDVGPRDSVG